MDVKFLDEEREMNANQNREFIRRSSGLCIEAGDYTGCLQDAAERADCFDEKFQRRGSPVVESFETWSS